MRAVVVAHLEILVLREQEEQVEAEVVRHHWLLELLTLVAEVEVEMGQAEQAQQVAPVSSYFAGN